MADFKDLKNRISLQRLVEDIYGIQLAPDGPDLKGCCPFHDEKTPSFTLTPDKDLFHCFGCGVGGDQIEFVRLWEKTDFKGAGDKLSEIVGGNDYVPMEREKAARKVPDKELWKPIVPVPEEIQKELWPSGFGKKTGRIYNPKRAGTNKEWTSFDPSAVYPYTLKNGKLVGYVLRVMIRGKKITPTLTYCEHEETKQRAWAMVALPAPRPLYRLTDLRFGGAVFLACEGEKVADYMGEKVPDSPVLGWAGGSNGIRAVDWEPLRGRKVFIIRDNDPSALAAAEGHIKETGEFVAGVAQILAPLGCEIFVVDPPEGKEKGWDCADEPDWDTEKFMQYIRRGMRAANNINMREEKPEAPAPGKSETDILYEQAIEFVTGSGRASIAGLQKHLRVGYNKAARFLELMERDGIVTVMNEHGRRFVPKVRKITWADKTESSESLPPGPDSIPPIEGDIPAPDDIPPERHSDDEGEDDSRGPDNKKPGAGPQPFKFLGFHKGPNGSNVHYFLAQGSRQVLSMTAGSLSKNNMLELAPLDWWSKRFEWGRGKAPFNMDNAVNFLIQQSSAAGIYDPTKTRGRGAWWDAGRSAIHLGSEVVIDGIRYPVEAVPSRYIYELSEYLAVSLDAPLHVSEAIQLVNICERVSWEKPINGKLLAGWIVCAIVCGALRWRPHIWVTGSAGSGKSTVIDLIMKRALAAMCLYVQGETSEAGIRQTLGSDAFPVLFDEAESERKNAAHRMDNVMALVTQASSDSSASIVKGTAGGKALAYKIRSCFAFSSIAVNLKQHAARSRVTVLGVKINRNADAQSKYDELLALIADTLTDDYVARLHSRAIKLIPVIRKNADTFSRAGSDALGSKRMGDQIGALLAGSYALHSNSEITEEAARKWIKEQDWSEERGSDETSDELACLSFIMETTHPASVGRTLVQRNIGELIALASANATDDDVSKNDADLALRRIGIKVEEKDRIVSISNTHHALAKILRDKSWENSWPRTLSRIEGAKKTDKPVRFGFGVQSRAVTIPFSMIFDNERSNTADF